jgi:hypothetical protein
VALAFSTNASQVLSVVQKDLLGLRRAADLTTASFDRAKLAAMGMAGVFVGAAVLSGVVKLVEHGRELVQQQSAMAQAGISNLEIAKATAAAWSVSRQVLTTNVTDNMRLIGDLRNMLGSMPEAIDVAPAMAKINAVLHNITGKPAEQAGYEFGRFLELRGALVNPLTHQIDPAQLAQQAKIGEAIIAGTRGRVNPHELLMFQQQARVAGMSLNQQGLLQIVPLIQAMGGARTGTFLTSASQQLLGATQLYKHSVEFLEKIGMLDPKKVTVGKGGRVQLHEGALRSTEMFRTETPRWVWEVLVPQMKAHGLTTTDQQIAALQASGLRTTVTGGIVEILRNEAAFRKDTQNIQTAAGVDQYGVMMATSPTAKIDAFKEAWQNLLTSLGAPGVALATDMMLPLAYAMNYLAGVASDHPYVVETLLGLATAIGVLAAVGGTLAIITAGLSGLAAPIRLLAGLGGAATAVEAVATAETAAGAAAIVAAPAIGRFATALGLLGGVLARLLPIAAFIYEMWPAPTQGPEADRAPYGGKSLAERFPELVVPPSVPAGPVAPGTVMPPMPMTPREWHQEIGPTPYQPQEPAAPPPSVMPPVVVSPDVWDVPGAVLPSPVQPPAFTPQSQTEWRNQEAEKQRQREAAMRTGVPPPSPQIQPNPAKGWLIDGINGLSTFFNKLNQILLPSAHAETLPQPDRRVLSTPLPPPSAQPTAPPPGTMLRQQPLSTPLPPNSRFEPLHLNQKPYPNVPPGTLLPGPDLPMKRFEPTPLHQVPFPLIREAPNFSPWGPQHTEEGAPAAPASAVPPPNVKVGFDKGDEDGFFGQLGKTLGAMLEGNAAMRAQIVDAIRTGVAGLTLTLDGRVVTQAVTERQAREGQRPPTDSGRYDATMSPLYPAYPY